MTLPRTRQPQRKDLAMDMNIQYSNHALERMNERNISFEKVEEILECGKFFSTGNGNYRVKMTELIGKTLVLHQIVFSKQSKKVITVWNSKKPYKNRDSAEDRLRSSLKQYRKRKQALREKSFFDYSREECRYWHIPAVC